MHTCLKLFAAAEALLADAFVPRASSVRSSRCRPRGAAAPATVDGGSAVDALKRDLLRAIARDASERAVLDAAAALEATATRTGAVDGRWGLVFSTQTARPADSQMQSLLDLPQEVSNARRRVPVASTYRRRGCERDPAKNGLNRHELDAWSSARRASTEYLLRRAGDLWHPIQSRSVPGRRPRPEQQSRRRRERTNGRRRGGPRR